MARVAQADRLQRFSNFVKTGRHALAIALFTALAAACVPADDSRSPTIATTAGPGGASDLVASVPDELVERAQRAYDLVMSMQGDLLDGSAGSLEPGRPGIVDLYFVGFAGFAHQDVFRKEVQSVRALFDERFDTRGRSIALINHPDTYRSTPLATRENLRETLALIGERMNREEDILFLFMTSHGSPDHRFVVDFWPFELPDITPGELRAMLDESGIRWHVVVVSACYSGAFVNALQDDNTLVMAASMADRNSFGCDNLNDYTYFGDAYFNTELREQFSFIDAFRDAARNIGNRERGEGLTPSIPQIGIGRDIESRLNEVEARLATAGRVASSQSD
jgi:hypothetical protein